LGYSDEPFVPLARFGNSFSDANSELDPETNLQFDLGVQGKWDQFSFTAKGFQATVYDYILPVPSNFSTPVPAGVNAPTNLTRDLSAFGIFPNTPGINFAASTHSLAYQYTNIDRASFYGGELTGEYKLNCGMALNGSLAYVKGTNHQPLRFDDATKTYIPTKGAEALPNIYPFNGQVGLRFFEPTQDNQPSRWSVEFIAQMVNGQYYVADSFGELPTPGFTIFNVNAYYQINENLRLRTSIDNLFDRDYTEHGSLAIANPLSRTLGFVREPGFTWTIGFEAKF
jgi:outer membrane receptor protein involved in Fe transport